MLKTYYSLTKPGIIYGNAITLAAGFFLASRGGHVDFFLLVTTFVGLSFVIASASIFNNLFDRDIDASMNRTKNRALVVGEISKQSATIYGVIVGLLGILILFIYNNLLTVGVAIFGFLVYVALYTPLKRRSVHATLIGSIAGAVPPVVGYLGVTGHFDFGALILFLVLVFWQMPHFYAIAIRRLDDYRSAGILVLPAVKSIRTTKIYMIVYIIAFIIATDMLTVFGFTGHAYTLIASLLGVLWLGFGISGFRRNIDNRVWAKTMFFASLFILAGLCSTIAVDAVLI